jgi:hypothetical protein
MTTNSENIIGLFVEPAQADTAIAELEAHGFSPFHIRASDERPMHRFLAQIKNRFTRNASNTDDNTQDITKLNIRDDDIRFYEHEITLGHVVVALNSDKSLQEAIDILHAHGAMTNYPLALYTSPHNEATDDSQLSETNNPTNGQIPRHTSTSEEKITTTHPTDVEDNMHISDTLFQEERELPIQKPTKPPIHAHAKRIHSRSK